MNSSVRLKLSAMMFLEFFIWGGWFVTLGSFLAGNLAASGAQTAMAYSTQSWGAIIAPFVIGLIAEQGRTLGQSQDNQVFVPLNSFRKTWGTRNSIDMLIKARGGVPGVESATDEVRAVLRAMRQASPAGTKTPQILSTIPCTSALVAWASRTIRAIPASLVSSPTFSARRRRAP